MISSANASSVSSLPVPSTSGKSASSSGEESTSFNDVMQQQQGPPTPRTADKTVATPTTAQPQTPDAKTPPADAKVTASSDVPAKDNAGITPAPVAAGSDLSAMLIQASVLATNLQQALAAKVISNPAGTTSDSPSAMTTGKGAPQLPASGADLSTLIAQATALLSGPGQPTPAKTSAPVATAPSDKSGKATPPAAAPAKDGTTSVATDLSTLMAPSSILPQTSVATASLGTDLPVSVLGKGLAGITTKEKKSAASSGEGSFLQSGAAGASTAANALGMVGTLAGVTGNASIHQSLTPTSGSKNNSLDALSSRASSLRGTANVEKGKAMSNDLHFPEIELLSGNGANTNSVSTGADLHIKLESNHDFTDALKQVMHVAQLTQTNESRTPMRVAMEIQTPPGAIVNVYVSRQNDQWRAQLSTNDPQALSWVQDQMTSLRQSSDMGVEVKWLPPQMETISTASGGQEGNLSWNQGGGQSNYQQPDDRQQSGRQQNSDAELELAAVGSNPFMSKLNALGRAA